MKPRFFLRSGNVEQRLRGLEWMSALAVAGCVISAAVAVFAFAAWETDAQTSPMPQALRVSELVVVDPKGVERVRIGGDLPDATINGKRVPRGEKAAGVLLYDGSGQERSGYVTFEPSGNVGLTLDTKKQQVALFAAGPDTGSTLTMRSGTDSIDLRSDEDGARITVVKAGQIVEQQPEIQRMSAVSCQAYKDAVARSSKDKVMQSCRQRFGEGACRACGFAGQ